MLELLDQYIHLKITSLFSKWLILIETNDIISPPLRVLLRICCIRSQPLISGILFVLEVVSVKKTLSLSISKHQKNFFLVLNDCILRNLFFVGFIILLYADRTERCLYLFRQNSLPLNILQPRMLLYLVYTHSS